MRTTLFFLSLFLLPQTQAASQTSLRFRDPLFPQVNTYQAVPYGSALNRYTKKVETLLMDIYTPKGDTWKARPAVVIVHGGGWVTGSRNNWIMVRIAKDFASRGFVAASIDYRMAPSYRVRKLPESAEDSQEDTKAAVRFLRRKARLYGVDPTRIAAIGSSAGGFAVVMASYYKEEGKSGNPGWSSKIQAVVDLWGGIFDEKEIQPGETPVMIVHGTADPVVSYNKFAKGLEARCKAVGVPVELHPLQGLGHAPWNQYSKILPWTLAWFHKHLRLSQVSGLKALPGYASPGTLHLVLSGPASLPGVLLVAAGTGKIDLGPLGVYSLDPRTTLPLALFTLPQTQTVAAKTLTLPVPPGLKGQTLHLQAFLSPWTLTNPQKTPF